MIAPVGEKLLFEHTKFSATRGGGDLPRHACMHVCMHVCMHFNKDNFIIRSRTITIKGNVLCAI